MKILDLSNRQFEFLPTVYWGGLGVCVCELILYKLHQSNRNDPTHIQQIKQRLLQFMEVSEKTYITSTHFLFQPATRNTSEK